ncbi:MAG: phosphate ABC transporter substrate-binding protein [Calditrichaeota bacterium]|nr:MAG: phosphate ABC transporter substrate-binding protein [Calditrichota bacterium]
MKSISRKVKFFVSLCFLLYIASCSMQLGPKKTIIRIKGSDTLLPLAKHWATAYMQENADVSIYVQGGGTATGAAALATGSADICTASRPLRSAEVQNIAQIHGSVGFSFLVAKEAIAIFLNKSNPVESFSLTEVKNIFTGNVLNWQELAWQDTSIKLYGRSPNSGTHHYLRQHVLQGQPYTSDVQVLAGTSAIVRAVQKDKFSIGYGGFAYGEGVKMARINNIAITPKNIRDASYPISRYLYLYTIDKPRGRVKKFIDWTMSQAGQRIALESGYLPVIELE